MGIAYVSDEALKTALEIEQRFQRLPASAGLLFVSVEPVPSPTGKTREFRVEVGLSRRFDKSVGEALVMDVFNRFFIDDFSIHLHVVRGVAGACRDPSATQGVGQPQA